MGVQFQGSTLEEASKKAKARLGANLDVEDVAYPRPGVVVLTATVGGDVRPVRTALREDVAKVEDVITAAASNSKAGWRALLPDSGNRVKVVEPKKDSVLWPQATPSIGMRADLKAASVAGSSLPELRIQRRLRSSGFSEDWCTRIASLLAPLQDPVLMKRALAVFLEANMRITVAPDLRLTCDTIVFVGPTGAGKSTACCKLASRLDGNRKVLLLAGDNRSLSGGALVSSYAQRANIQSEYLQSAHDIRALQEGVTIIDTPGLPLTEDPAAHARLAEIASLHPTSAFVLVLPATFSAPLLERTIRSYGHTVQLAAVLISHLDEAKGSIGSVIEKVREHQLPFSYISKDQALSRPLETVTGQRIAELIMEEF